MPRRQTPRRQTRPPVIPRPPHALAVFGTLLALAISPGCDEASDSGRVQLPSPSLPGATEFELDAQLSGQHVTGLSIEVGNWSNRGSGETIDIAIHGEGMSGIGQFFLDLELEPVALFDLDASAFEPAHPFVTIPGGLERIQGSDNQIRIGAADLNRTTSGTAALGTLHLVGSSLLDPQSTATVRVLFFSMGPDSQSREDYPAADLNMSVVINPR